MQLLMTFPQNCATICFFWLRPIDKINNTGDVMCLNLSCSYRLNESRKQPLLVELALFSGRLVWQCHYRFGR